MCRKHCLLMEAIEVAHCYLDGNADAVEFCPHEPFHRVLAAATYTLQEGDKPTRTGSISLFDVDAEVGSLSLLHRVETVGIFDIKWAPPVSGNADRTFLAQAGADGYLRMYSLEGSFDECKLSEIASASVSSSMCLCLDWNPSASSTIVGLSDGSIAMASISESRLEITQEWSAHDFEVWAATFDVHQPDLVFTGADDCKFACWDLREGPCSVVFRNSKAHKMGVCCISKTPDDPFKLLTGSYDENLRVWDLRSMSKPVNEIELCLGGGVWRVKHHPSLSNVVLAACMHNGYAIVKTDEGGAEVLETYNEHGSLAYGADWCKGEAREKRNVVATCSFYDRLVRVWRPGKLF